MFAVDLGCGVRLGVALVWSRGLSVFVIGHPCAIVIVLVCVQFRVQGLGREILGDSILELELQSFDTLYLLLDLL